VDRKQLKVLAAGFGSIGQRHLKNLHTLGIHQLAYADPSPNPETVLAVAKQLDLKEYNDFDTALKEFQPDVVFVCTPPALHMPYAIAAAKSGADLFIEKPLSHALGGYDELVKLVEQKSLVCMVGCNMRFHVGPEHIKRLLEEDAIGTVLSARLETGSYLPRWRPGDYRQSYSSDSQQGGALLDQIHEIDLALWYFGPASVVGSAVVNADCIDIPVDGIAEVLLRHDTGVVSSVQLSFLQQNYKRRCEIVGSSGTIEWDIRRKCVDLYGSDGLLKSSYEDPPDWEVNQAFISEIAYFLQCIQSRERPHPSLLEGKAALDVSLSVRSAL
jgi:predicted dehydrogenase